MDVSSTQVSNHCSLLWIVCLKYLLVADNGHAPVDVDKELGEPSGEVVHKPIRHTAQGGLDMLRELAVVVFLRWAHSDNGDWYDTAW